MRRLIQLAVLIPFALLACRNQIVCPVGEVACSGRCVSLLSDEANCGACGHACGSLEACSAGTCGCAAGVATCGAACTDLARDPDHCGACDTACATADYCTTAAGATSCTAACPDGFTACGRSCVELASDVRNCGACGRACAPGESCRAGACAADVYVACYATGDVRPVDADLLPAGSVRDALGGPTVIAAAGRAVYSGNGFPAGLAVIPIDPRLASTVTVFPGSDDVEGVTPYGGAVLVSNVTSNTIVVLDAAGRVLDELVLPVDGANPHGAAFVGTTAYVALQGYGADATHPATTGQRLAKIDLSALPACMADTNPPPCGAADECPPGTACRAGRCRVRCGTVTGTVDLAVPGSADASGVPFPTRVAARGSTVYVTLSNLKQADCGGGFVAYCAPAGHGKLAVVDTAAGDAVSILDLGERCANPGDLDLAGDRLWISCGSFAFRDAAPGTIVSVSVAAAPALEDAPLDASAIVPGNLAICGGFGYVTDQGSGAVLRFDPATRQVGPKVDVCPLSPIAHYAYASDVACP